MTEPDLSAVLRRIPLLRKITPGQIEITELPGYTNENYRLRSGDSDWVLRLPKAATDAYIDRRAEAHNQALAGQLDLAPQALWRDEDGASLTASLPGRCLRPVDLNDDALLVRLAAVFARLHRHGLQFRGRVDLAELLERYYGLLSTGCVLAHSKIIKLIIFS